MIEIKSITYEEARAEHFKALMKKMERKIDYWQSRGQYSLKPGGELSRANVECSEAGMQYSFYKDALEALEAQPKWISVDNPPKRDGAYIVLIKTKSGKTFKAQEYYDVFNGWCYEGWYDGGYIAYWMPFDSLPEPPKEEA